MTDKAKQKTKAKQKGDQRTSPRQAPKVVVAESGEMEQGTPIEPMGQQMGSARITAKEIAERKEREDYHHGGIPIGSDPRE